MMDDEYLWTRTGSLDEDVRDLERLLERYRYRQPLRDATSAPSPNERAPDGESADDAGE